MVKKLSVLFLLPILVLTLAANANAQNSLSTPSAVRQRVSDIVKERKQTVTEIRELAKESVMAKRDEFKKKLEIVKDERKKLILERIDEKISEINTKHTDKFAEAILRLQNFLDELSAGVTDTPILNDIKIAQGAIDAAQASVEAQAAKSYSITITSETTLRQNAGTTISLLRKDLKTVHKLIMDAKQAVIKVKTAKNSTRRSDAVNSADL